MQEEPQQSAQGEVRVPVTVGGPSAPPPPALLFQPPLPHTQLPHRTAKVRSSIRLGDQA